MKGQITDREIMAVLKAEKAFLGYEFGVVNIGLFGSYAKGKQDIDSDIDIIVELKEPRFDWLAGLQLYLEAKFGKKIELVRKGKNVNHRFTQRIERYVTYA